MLQLALVEVGGVFAAHHHVLRCSILIVVSHSSSIVYISHAAGFSGRLLIFKCHLERATDDSNAQQVDISFKVDPLVCGFIQGFAHEPILAHNELIVRLHFCGRDA